MAKVIYKSYNPNDNLLLPPCLGDYLPQNHPSRVVSAIIDRLDISEIEAGYKGGGTSSYNPRMLLKVIVYAYLNNVYSGRQMEKLLVENIAYMWLSGMQTPDFRTINIFRSQRLADGLLDERRGVVVAELPALTADIDLVFHSVHTFLKCFGGWRLAGSEGFFLS